MHQDIIDRLYSLYEENGYVSEDSVFDALIANKLPIDEINILCNTLLSMGVIIKSDDFDNDDVIYDRSQIDYGKLFDEVIAIDPTVEPFIDKIRDIRPPQHREWQNLILSAQNGNLYSRDRIALMYLRLVVKTAMWHYKKFGITLSDAIQNGCVGLLVALEKYELGRHNNFVQHASNWIRQYIMREADPTNSLIYYPAHYKERLFSVYEIYAVHDCELCEGQILCPNLLNEIAHTLCCAYDEATELLAHLIPMDSVDDMLETSEDFFSDRGEFAERMLEDYTDKEVCFAIDNILKVLKSREETILRLRYGFYDNEEKTLDDIGQRYGLTRERVRQIEAKALRKLRQQNNVDRLKSFW